MLALGSDGSALRQSDRSEALGSESRAVPPADFGADVDGSLELDLGPATETTPSEAAQAESIASTPIVVPEAEKTKKAPKKKKGTD
jgi:hypothetical protein